MPIKREAVHADALFATLESINWNYGQGDVWYADLGHIEQGVGYAQRKFQYGGDARSFTIIGQAEGASRYVKFLGHKIKVRSPYDDDLPPPPVMVVPMGVHPGLQRQLFSLSFPWVEKVNLPGLWRSLWQALSQHGSDFDAEQHVLQFDDPNWGKPTNHTLYIQQPIGLSVNDLQQLISEHAWQFCTPGKVEAEEQRQRQLYPLSAEFRSSIMDRAFTVSNARRRSGR
jgi:hypothetical protein